MSRNQKDFVNLSVGNLMRAGYDPHSQLTFHRQRQRFQTTVTRERQAGLDRTPQPKIITPTLNHQVHHDRGLRVLEFLNPKIKKRSVKA